MLVLGIAGGISPIHERPYDLPPGITHDAAAALLLDGKILTAIEEERLNRIKHTNKAPISAIRFCVEQAGVSLEQIDKLAIYGGEASMNGNIRTAYLSRARREPFIDIRKRIRMLLRDELGFEFQSDRLSFIPHHMAHAQSAYAPSGFSSGLILTVDGSGGDGVAGMVLNAEGENLQVLHVIPDGKSLGHFYLRIIRYLGFSNFDEYKVMGLAPYGDPSVYRSYFKSFYSLLPQGEYVIHWSKFSALFGLGPPRVKGGSITQAHKDLASSLQESLEDIVFHILRHYQKLTGRRNLCLAGGVAHNCTLNGKLLYSNLFERIFVQPAAHDAGCAVGAAFEVFRQEKWKIERRELDHVYWGAKIDEPEDLETLLNDWSDLLEFEKPENIAETTARLLDGNYVVGWVQGRSEFGPRALGNRSILADPRPAQNKEIINAMIKKREAFRPFAPAVLEERVDEYFDLPTGKARLDFMTFVVRVRKEMQALLGAVSHVDGTARVQTVSKSTNRDFWNLIQAFGDRTGVYLLLNTSFNNNAEPVVNTAGDAIACFLTTGLHYLVIGDYLIRKRPVRELNWLGLSPSLHKHSRLSQVKRFVTSRDRAVVYEIGNSYDDEHSVPISPAAFRLLSASDGEQSLKELMDQIRLPEGQRETVVNEMLELWEKRVIALNPLRKEICDSALIDEPFAIYA
jgi:carbamoyltransferase